MKKDRPKTLVYRKGEKRYDRDSYGSDRPQLYPAICANCGKKTEVPFNPTGDKPVYCRDCFNQQDHDSVPRGRRFGGGRDRGGNASSMENLERRLKRIEDKIDELLASI